MAKAWLRRVRMRGPISGVIAAHIHAIDDHLLIPARSEVSLHRLIRSARVANQYREILFHNVIGRVFTCALNFDNAREPATKTDCIFTSSYESRTTFSQQKNGSGEAEPSMELRGEIGPRREILRLRSGTLTGSPKPLRSG